MTKKEALKKLIQFLKENKVKVIFDSKVKEGGRCRLYEKNYIIIPSTYNLEKKLSILIEAINNLNININEEIKEIIKKYL
ncbi:MAG: hypothetical protein RMJ34_06080 [candidate division WOR-3 bacterium]|nr:hypothetical protein [candidate division WOR-3 bacterium]